MNKFMKEYGVILFLIMFLVCVVAVVHVNSISNGFVYDDTVQILQNPWIKDIQYIGKIFTSDVWAYYQTAEASNYYRPLANIFYMVTWHFFGADARAFHAVNILLHISVVVLIFLLVLKLLDSTWLIKGRFMKGLCSSDTNKKLGAFIVALLFGVHTIHSEAVNWISGIMELMFTLFGLMSFYFFLDHERKGFLVLSSSFFLIALFSKETAVVFLPFFFLYDLCCGEKRFNVRTSFITYIPYVIALVLYFLIRTYAVGEFAPVNMHPDLSNYECVLNVFPQFTEHLWKLLWPVNLSIYHVFEPVRSIFEPRTVLGLCVSICYLGCLYWSWKRDRFVFFALVLIGIPLLPYFYIRGIGPTIFEEQHLYLSSLGFLMLPLRIYLWVDLKSSKFRYGFYFLVLIALCFYSVMTVQRNGIWKDNLSVWRDAVKKYPESAIVHESLAGGYLEHGRIDEAIDHYHRAVKFASIPSARLYNNLGTAYTRKGKMDEAIGYFMQAISIRPEYARAHLGLGVALDAQGRTDKAIEAFQNAVRYDPYLADAYNNLGVAYAKQGNFVAAQQAMKQATTIDPEYYKKKMQK